jgi:SAM-dependent methyltransferase
MAFAYDQVLYKSYPMAQTHPDHLAALAILFGMHPAPPQRCRVLELGCGNGANLIPMALTLPESRFAGVDLAERPIEMAQSLAGELGLGNCTFHQIDLAELTPAFGEFDYIVAHGVYSWVPPEARDKLLAVCQSLLAANGVAYVSYNTYPGCHLRNITRDMMLYQTRGIDDPDLKLERASELIRFLAAAEPTAAALREELRVVESRDPSVVFHDDLAEVNQPVYFHQFVEHARAHGLEFLAEAQFSSMQEAAFSPEVVEGVRRMAQGDRIRSQQYMDFLKCRRFRQTLLCHAGTPLEDPPDSRHTRRLWAACAATPVSEEEFRSPDGASIRTNLPAAQAAMLHLGRSWPRAVSFDELAAEAGPSGGAEILADLLLRACAAGLVQLHAMPSPFVVEPGARPRASALARLQARAGAQIATLRHSEVEIQDRLARRLVCHLDGTRDRAALLRDLQPFAAPAVLHLEDLERNLAKLARMALLEA